MFKQLAIGFASLGLSACMGAQTPSSASSSEAISSTHNSSVTTSSSSSLAASSLPRSSSVMQTQSSSVQSSAPASATGNFAAGKAIYEAQCIGCHGANGKGPIKDMTQLSPVSYQNFQALVDYNDEYMPNNKGQMCQGQCALDVTRYIVDQFKGIRWDTVSSQAASSSAPAAAVVIPSKIQSEDFSNAFDTTPENKGGCGDLNQSVDLQPVVAGNIGTCDVNWVDAGEWLEYRVKVQQSATFKVIVSVAAQTAGRTLNVAVDGVVLGQAESPAEGWTLFRNRTVGEVALTAGTYTVRVNMITGGLNFNFISFTEVTQSSSSSAPTTDTLNAGRQEWEGQCANCHGLTGQGGAGYPAPINMAAKTRAQWIDYIYQFMPKGNSAKTACDLDCSTVVTDFMLAGYPGLDIEEIACTGDIKDHLNPPIRSLTTVQYSKLIADVFSPLGLNLDTLLPDALMKDSVVGGFTNNAGVVVDSNNLDNLIEVAEKIANTAANNFAKLMPCGNGEACVREFIAQYGSRLFRDAPTATQITGLVNLFKTGTTNKDGVKYVVTAMLLSPQTLYQYEQTVDTRKLVSGKEIASRLSFMIWNAAPDAALLQRAANGDLNAVAGIQSVVESMLKDERAAEGIGQFYADYLHIDPKFNVIAGTGGSTNTSMPQGECSSTTQCKQLYDGATDCKNSAGGVCYCGTEVCAQLGGNAGGDTSGVKFGINGRQAADEIKRFTSYLTREVPGTFQDLMLSRTAFVDNATAKIYGVTDQQLANAPLYLGGKQVELNANQRAGLLTRIGFVIHGGGQAVGLASPTDRGIVVRKSVLCQELPKAPGDVKFPEPPNTNEKTWVEVVKEIHLAGENACTQCHKPMDPVGFGFENYTLNGEFIDTYPNGKPVDASGMFYPIDTSMADVDNQSFNNALGLSEIIADSETAASCFSLRWSSYALARDANNNSDACAIEQVEKAFKDSNYTLSELIVAIATNPAFRFRNPE